MKMPEIVKIAKMSKSTIRRKIKSIEQDADREYREFKNVLGGACTSTSTNGMPTGHVKQVIIDFLNDVLSGELTYEDVGLFFAGQLSDQQLHELGFKS